MKNKYFSPYNGGKIHIARDGAYRFMKNGDQAPLSLCSITTNTSKFLAENTTPDEKDICKRCLKIDNLKSKEN